MGIVKSDKCKETLINQILKEKQAVTEEQIAYEQLLCMTVDGHDRWMPYLWELELTCIEIFQKQGKIIQAFRL